MRHRVEPWLSFMAGALASSLVWSLGWAARRFLFPPESRLKWGDSGGSDDDEESSTSISDEADFSPSSKSKLARWPWETLRNSVINMSTSFLNVEGVGYESHQDDDVSADSKTGPCIGEIFGLDVGGTLTKLVYFEQEIVEYKRQESHEGLHPDSVGPENTTPGAGLSLVISQFSVRRSAF